MSLIFHLGLEHLFVFARARATANRWVSYTRYCYDSTVGTYGVVGGGWVTTPAIRTSLVGSKVRC